MACTLEYPCAMLFADMEVCRRLQYQKINKAYIRCMNGHSFWVEHTWPRVSDPIDAIMSSFKHKNNFEPRPCAYCRLMIVKPNASMQEYHTACLVQKNRERDLTRSSKTKKKIELIFT